MGISGAGPDVVGRSAGKGSAWCQQHAELIATADAHISAQLADRKSFPSHTLMSLSDEVFTIMKASLSSAQDSENGSVLILGEAGSGKTHVVEWCLKELSKVQPSLVVLRARGGTYASDVECIRHLAAQATTQMATGPHKNASFEQSMEWIRSVLAESFKGASAVVVVLDKFEYFCSKAKQTVLYNLFDVAQDAGVRLSIIGTSEKMDVMLSLEKRIESRFSMRHLHTFLPQTMDDLIQVLMTRLRPPSDCGLKPSFVKDFGRRVEEALRVRAPRWRDHLELGRPPSWFLARCLPVSSLLLEQGAAESAAAGAPPPAKRARHAPPPSLPSATEREMRALLLGGLSESEHIVLLALLRMSDRRVGRTLSAVLHEVKMLHEQGGLLACWSQDLYCAAFDRLLQARLVEFHGHSGNDLAKRYQPCVSLVDRAYGDFVLELGRAEGASSSNPLRSLPMTVQQWASRQRPAA